MDLLNVVYGVPYAETLTFDSESSGEEPDCDNDAVDEKSEADGNDVIDDDDVVDDDDEDEEDE